MRKTQVLNNTLDEMDLIDIFRTFHPNTEEYTFFSSEHGTVNLRKLKSLSSIFSDTLDYISITRKKLLKTQTH